MTANASIRMQGLDTIRFVCALWVLLEHLVLAQLYRDAATRGPLEALATSVGANSISGAAAVIAFFVISGLCIHYPNRDGALPNLAGYYASRYVRIGVPLVAALVLSQALNLQYSLFEHSILWSLFAELIYYTIYPLLLVLRRHLGWPMLLAIAFAASAAVIFSHPPSPNYPVYGTQLNWLVGLPCWLLGCLVAERVGQARQALGSGIWLWRAGVWLASAVCIFLRFHTPIGFPITLTLFAVIVALWLSREIAHFQVHRPSRWLEALGAFSYSLYLVHLIGAVLLRQLVPIRWGLPGYLIEVAFAVAFSYGFYRLIEHPAHLAARKLKGLRWPLPGPRELPKPLDG